jgi:DNA invertase Pin-like site-specific DNA recombinase
MEEVVIYTRVSTDEQADKGYSLRDQTARLKNCCALYDLTVVGHFQDDFSAKTFERPEFIKLLNFIKDRKAVRKILFLKWDRFSRNLNDAMNMLVKLRKMNVEANAIEQIIDFSIPEQKMMLAIYLTAPEIENTRRAMNTTQGMRRAKGRQMGFHPPLDIVLAVMKRTNPSSFKMQKHPWFGKHLNYMRQDSTTSKR